MKITSKFLLILLLGKISFIKTSWSWLNIQFKGVLYINSGYDALKCHVCDSDTTKECVESNYALTGDEYQKECLATDTTCFVYHFIFIVLFNLLP